MFGNKLEILENGMTQLKIYKVKEKKTQVQLCIF